MILPYTQEISPIKQHEIDPVEETMHRAEERSQPIELQYLYCPARGSLESFRRESGGTTNTRKERAGKHTVCIRMRALGSSALSRCNRVKKDQHLFVTGNGPNYMINVSHAHIVRNIALDVLG